ncbi:MAG: ribonuclease R [Prevotella sp.]|nr:ribonuclease R [Prevotella sp.]
MSKKTSGRFSRKRLTDALEALFRAHPMQTLTTGDIFTHLKVRQHPARMQVLDVLENMAWEDFLSKDGDSGYRLNERTQIAEGTFVRKANGKNTFQPDDGGTPVFVAERNSMFALNGDRVRVVYMARRLNHIKEAVVTEILSHKMDQAVGQLVVEPDFAFLQTEGNIFVHDIIIPKKKLHGGKNGDVAVVRITQWPTAEQKTIVGEVVDVLGERGDNTVEMHAILAKYGLPYKYPERVEQAANKIADTIAAADLEGREDFRQVLTFTIDPKDAKDFDDALSFRTLDGRSPAGAAVYEVGVHIADVSHYVKERDIIDREAEQRATSVYLVDRTIPMLPERLCNNICSLRPHEDKLCYSVVFNLDGQANILDWRLRHTVINSDHRLCYEEALEMLEKEEEARTDSPTHMLHHALKTLSLLAQQLRERRFKAGAVRFDREELHFDVDQHGHPTRCYYKKSNLATQLIEEFMLLANRQVAEYIGAQCAEGKKADGRKPTSAKAAKTFVYRIHDEPDPTKVEQLREFVVKFGYKMKTTGSKGAVAKAMNKLMLDCQGHKEQNLIETVALRAMMKAKYSTHNIGHYGLAFDYYTHFTSPIRRYPDMMVHRLLTRYQQGGRSANQHHFEDECKHSSDMEQLAQQAERESIKMKMVEFMSDYIGQDFDAHISGVQSYGIYCEIDENHCEGMVGMHDLTGDYYDFDEQNYRLRGRRNHKVYQLGDPIRIRVARANVEKRQLDFVLANTPAGKQQAPSHKSAGKTRRRG